MEPKQRNRYIFNMVLGFSIKAIGGKALVKQQHRLVGTFDLNNFIVTIASGAIIFDRVKQE